MKTNFLLAALGGSTLVNAQWTVQSKAFKLILRSTNATLDGTNLGACHQHAALEDLCAIPRSIDPNPSSYTPFNHNTTSNDPSIPNNPGILQYILGGGEVSWPSAMSFDQLQSGSNTWVPLFFPGNSPYTLVWFDDIGVMYIPVDINGVSVPAENWWVCYWTYGPSSYTRERVVWVEGNGTPDFGADAHCQKVRVQREFVE